MLELLGTVRTFLEGKHIPIALLESPCKTQPEVASLRSLIELLTSLMIQ
jgi:hypothetical protein